MFETIYGCQITSGDLLEGHDGSLVKVTQTWIEKDQLYMRYVCDNGDVLDMPVHGRLKQRRWIAQL